MYFNKLIRRAHLERDIDALPCVNIHAYIVGGEFREAFVLNADCVEADLDVEEIVITAIVRGDLVFDACVTAGERHCGLRNRSPASVLDSAEDFGGLELAEEQTAGT